MLSLLTEEITCISLLVPPRATTDHVHVPKASWKFACDHLPSGFAKPTVNLLRKYVYVILMELSPTEEKLIGLMQVIDAHSVSVARKHYVLRDPVTDAKLAQKVVAVAFGDTVPWPSTGKLEQCYASGTGQLFLPSCGWVYDGHGDAPEATDEDKHECRSWNAFLWIQAPSFVLNLMVVFRVCRELSMSTQQSMLVTTHVI